MANVGDTLMTDDERAILDPGVIPKTYNTVGRKRGCSRSIYNAFN